MAKKKEGTVTADLGIAYSELYAILEEAGKPATIYNVKELCDYLRTTARDAAHNALIDYPDYCKILEQTQRGE